MSINRQTRSSKPMAIPIPLTLFVRRLFYRSIQFFHPLRDHRSENTAFTVGMKYAFPKTPSPFLSFSSFSLLVLFSFFHRLTKISLLGSNEIFINIIKLACTFIGEYVLQIGITSFPLESKLTHQSIYYIYRILTYGWMTYANERQIYLVTYFSVIYRYV